MGKSTISMVMFTRYLSLSDGKSHKNPIFNSYVKLPEGILASILARSDGSPGRHRWHRTSFPEHSHPPAASTPKALGCFVRYLDGSVSKPCTPGEHQNSW